MSYASQQPYGGPVPMPEVRAPDIASAGLPARQLAEGIANVGEKWAGFWNMAEQAKAVSDAGRHAASASMELGDMVRGFDQDPDPAGAAERFRQRAMEWRTEKLQGLDPGVQRVLDRTLNQLIPAGYNQVAGRAAERTRTNLRAGLADTLGGFAQGLAAAPDEPTTLAQLEGIKATIAGHVASGVLPQSEATKSFSTALAQAITIRGAQDPIAAQRMLDRFKAEMDATTVAHLTTSLRAPVERREDEGAAERATAIPQATRERANAVIDGLVARGIPRHVAIGLAANAVQESGANPNVQPGDGGASDGLFQWRDSRRQAFVAQYGVDPSKGTLDQQLDFAVAELKGSEKRAGDALSGARTPEEAARLASTLYLRPRDTAVEERRRAGYASVLAGGSPRQMALEAVRSESQGLPLGRLLHREALVEQFYNHAEARLAQERSLLATQLHDLGATYQGGNTTAPIPEDRIRAVLPAETAQRTIDELGLQRTAGDALKAAAFATPADIDALRTRLAGNPVDTYLAAERQKLVSHFDQGVQRIRTAIKDDPGGYAATAPDVQDLVRNGGTPQQIIAAQMAVQARMGVMPSARRLLTNDRATQMAELLRSTGPEKADMGATLAGLAHTFGADDPEPSRRATGAALFNAALGELAKGKKIDWAWIAFAGMDRPEQARGRALFQEAKVFEAQKGGPEAVAKLLPEGAGKELRTELDSALTDLRTVTSHHPGGLEMFDNTRRTVETIAQMRVLKGESPGQAAKNAYNDVIGHKWEPAGDDGSGWMFDTHTMLVPKGKAGMVEATLAQVRGAIQPADIMPLSDPMRRDAPEAELRDATASAARRGFWINNADGSGAVLVGRSTGGGIINIRRADGSAIEVLFEHLPRAGQAFAAGLPQAPADQPAAGQPATPQTARDRFWRAMSHPSFDPYTAAFDAAGNFVGGVLGIGVERMPPAIVQGSEMPPSTVTYPDRPAERLPMGRFALPSIPSWSQRAQERYGRRSGISGGLDG